MITPSSSTTPNRKRNVDNSERLRGELFAFLEEADPHGDGKIHAPQRQHDESARCRDEDAEVDDGRDPPGRARL